MTASDDTDGVIHRFITEDQAERLLAGTPDVAGDAALTPVHGLLQSLREPGRADEVHGADELVAQLSSVARGGGRAVAFTPGAHRRPRRPIGRLVTGKVVAVAAATLLSAGAAAAATGSLPDPIQRTVSDTFSHVGVDLPKPADEPATTVPGSTPVTSSPAKSAKNGKGATTNPPVSSGSGSSTVTSTPPGTANGPSGPTTGPGASSGTTVDTVEPGNSGSTPAVTAPGTSGSTTTSASSVPGVTITTGTTAAPGVTVTTTATTAASDPSTTTHGSSATAPGQTAPGRTTPDKTTKTTNNGKANTRSDN